MAQTRQFDSREKTVIKATGLSSGGKHSQLQFVDVKDGKIIRIRPFHYDWKYKPEEFNPWQIKERGKVLEPPMKCVPGPHGMGYKKRIFSPNRILYPLKRIDWDPKGERNTHNRGISKYVRISWDEATDIIATEIRRIHKNYGPFAVFSQQDGHGETKGVHSTHGCNGKLFNLMGGFTLQVRTPDSWEGWYWGAKHVWGMESVGLQWPNNANILPDVCKNSELLLFWGADCETTPWGFGGGQFTSNILYHFTDIGIKCLYICPDLNYAAAVHADKWIPILPNTDVAMQLAIAYIWITEGTYDKDYVATHTVGFDKFQEYVLGKEDGVAKTPSWAAEKCGVPSRIIKALAREWATKPATICHGLGGPYIRGPYASEPARMEVVLLAMQGLGKPGINQYAMIEGAFFASVPLGHRCYYHRPWGIVEPNVAAAYRGYDFFDPMPKQIIPKTMVHDAILNGKFTIYGSGYQVLLTEDQFIKYDYPAEGCSPIHMIWTDSPCLMTCWNDSNSIAKAYQHPSIEFIVAQHPWLENDVRFADIILPINTKFEENDIGENSNGDAYDSIFLEEQCIEPLGESKSDYEAVCAVAEKLGMLDEYTGGKSIEEWMKTGFDKSGVPEAGLCTWEQLKEKKYYVVPTDPAWETMPAGLYEFYENPEKHPLRTPSGKLEIYSQRLAENFPDDDERPPIPKWIEKSESHDERISGERARKYPLLCQSNHPRWRVHAQLDDVNWFHEIVSCKVRGSDGYLYEPCWMHPTEAKKRGIKDGDVVKVHNERGTVLCGARIWERIMPGVAYVDHGARYDPIVPGEFDRGGAINTICPHNVTSRNAVGHVVTAFLVEVERVDLDELRKQYPETFSRPYHQASGLTFERVLYNGGKQK